MALGCVQAPICNRGGPYNCTGPLSAAKLAVIRHSFANRLRYGGEFLVIHSFEGLALIDPLFDRFLIEAPVRTHLEGGNLPFFEQAIDGRGMDLEEARDFF